MGIQDNYNFAPAIGIAGALADSGNHDIRTMVAHEPIKPGQALVRCSAFPSKVRLPHVNQATITLSGEALDASDTLTSIVNGVTVTNIFASSESAQVIAHEALIEAIPGISAVVTSARVITVTAENDTPLSCTTAVGGGATAVVTVVDGCADAFYGLAVYTGIMHPKPYPGTVIYDTATFVTGGTLTDEVVTFTVNGTALTAVTYATSHANTMGLLKAMLLSAADIIAVTVDTNTLTIYAPVGRSLTVSAAITGTIATSTITQLTQDPNYGVVQYDAEDSIAVLRKGRLNATSEDAAVVTDTVYMRFKTSGVNVPGGIRTDADTATAVAATGLNFDSAGAAGGIVVLEVNLP